MQHLEKFHQDTSGYTQPRPGSPQSNFKAHSVKGSPIVSTKSVPSVPTFSPSSSITITPKFHNSSLSPSLNNKSTKSIDNHNHAENRNPLIPKIIHSKRKSTSLLPSTSTNGSIGIKPSPVTCSTCGKSFSRQSVLNVHSQMVHGATSSLKSLNKSNSILSAVRQSVVPSVDTTTAAGDAAEMTTDDTDNTSVGSNYEAQCSLRSNKFLINYMGQYRAVVENFVGYVDWDSVGACLCDVFYHYFFHNTYFHHLCVSMQISSRPVVESKCIQNCTDTVPSVTWIILHVKQIVKPCNIYIPCAD